MRRALPLLLGVGLVVAFLHRLLLADAVLAVRDMPLFHLPLRQALARLMADGLPLWNPWLHGGQPVLSNPNYAVFYPPTWLLLLIPAYLVVNLLIVGHALLGFAGAWRFARHLECDRPAAALAAVGFTAGGAFISSPNTLTLFCGLAWLPWILMWGDRALRAGGRGWLRPALAAAVGLAAQLLAGEPVVPLIGALALVCLLLSAPRPLLRSTRQVLVIGLLAIGLGAVQLTPTLFRILDSPRAGGLASDDATSWSMPPERLIEWVVPHFFGDPTRSDENLYFGWGVHDRNYPYVISILPGLLVLVLAATALARWPIPRRRTWIAMVGAGLFLAFGRFNPLYLGTLDSIPPFSLIRYPEKFILLATTALPFAAALGWQRLLDRRRAGHTTDAEFPLALATVLAAVTATFAIVLAWRPDVGAWWVQGHTPLRLSADLLEAGTEYLSRESLAALVPALIAMILFGLLRWGRRVTPAIAWAAVIVLGAELWYYGRDLNTTLPAADLFQPPPLAAALPTDHGRLFTDLAYVERSEFVTRSRREGPNQLWTSIERLDPYSGLLWDLSYALHPDYDLMLTGWARFSLDQFEAQWDDRETTRRILGAWGVSQRIRVQSLQRVLKRRLAGRSTPPAQLQSVPQRLPTYRFVPRVTVHPDRASAAVALVASGFRVARDDHWVASTPLSSSTLVSAPVRGRELHAARDTTLLELTERPAGIELRYRASEPTLFVAAITFDRGWSANIENRPVPLHPTGLGQIGIILPAGEHLLALGYRDRSLPWGAALSLATLLGALAEVRRRSAGSHDNVQSARP